MNFMTTLGPNGRPNSLCPLVATLVVMEISVLEFFFYFDIIFDLTATTRSVRFCNFAAGIRGDCFKWMFPMIQNLVMNKAKLVE